MGFLEDPVLSYWRPSGDHFHCRREPSSILAKNIMLGGGGGYHLQLHTEQPDVATSEELEVPKSPALYG
jgi:hypothetical protein